MKGYLLITTITLLILAGCSHRPVPVATSYPVTAQRKMQAIHHWDVLAGDVAKRLKKTLQLTFPNAAVKPSLLIEPNKEQEKVAFGKAFHSLLTTKLVQQGLVVLTSNADHNKDTLVVNYNMQVVHHKDRRLTYPPPGTYSLLAGGVWMIDQAIEHWKYPGLAAFPLTVLADVNSMMDYYLPGETNTEVLITTSVIMEQQHIFGDARIYYVNDDDCDHYNRHCELENGTKNYQVVNQ